MNDRRIVADAFFAEGTKPVFMTADRTVFNSLYSLSGRNPGALGNTTVGLKYPTGFDVTINNRTITVIPVTVKK